MLKTRPTDNTKKTKQKMGPSCAACANTTVPLRPHCVPPPVQPLRASLRCRAVVYTALIGPYDDFERFANAHAPQVDADAANAQKTKQPQKTKKTKKPSTCYVAVVDALRGRNYSYWTPAVVPRLFPREAARSAHALKSVPWQLFPRAEWVLYIDAKTTLSVPAPIWVDRMRHMDERARLHVLRHPHGTIGTASNGLVREIAAERRWVLKRRREHWLADVGDIDAQERRYCAYAPLCAIGGVAETSLMLWRRTATRALHRLACHWYHEIRTGSQREQLSFPYVVHALGVQSHVHYVAYDSYRRYWGWLDHRACDAKGVCRFAV